MSTTAIRHRDSLAADPSSGSGGPVFTPGAADRRRTANLKDIRWDNRWDNLAGDDRDYLITPGTVLNTLARTPNRLLPIGKILQRGSITLTPGQYRMESNKLVDWIARHPTLGFSMTAKTSGARSFIYRPA